jgi:hypothetical protein
MATPESITVSLDWAKELREAGWPQQESSLYTWVQKGKDEEDWSESFLELSSICWRLVRVDTFHPDFLCAAPTAEEILRRLPPLIINSNVPYHLDPTKKLYMVSYDDENLTGKVEHGDSLANAAAATYCYLAECNLLPKP